jgi:hypothetical protein
MKGILLKIGVIKEKKPMSSFSQLFQNASSREKRAFFLDVAKKATEDQSKIMRMRL